MLLAGGVNELMNIGLAILLALIVGWFLYQKRPVKGVRSISPTELPGCLKGRNNVLVDVREQHEYESGHVGGMKNIPLGQITGRLSELPKEKEIVLICRSGNRSLMAARMLRRHGYEKVVNVRGGILAWKGPLVK